MPPLLQTASHEKLAKGFSHPTSTERLSDALEGVPQFADMRLHFRAHEGKVLGENHRLHGAAAKALEGYRLFLECGWNEADGWRVDVYSVPSARKATLTSACAHRALPALRDWLSTQRHESWFIGRRYFQMAASEFTDELALREIHNDRVESQRELLVGTGNQGRSARGGGRGSRPRQ